MQNIQTNRSLSLPTLISLAFGVAAIGLRLVPHPDNFACFGALAFFCGMSLRGAARWYIPVACMFVGDWVGHVAGISTIAFYHVPSMILNYVGFAAMIAVGAGAQRSLKAFHHDSGAPIAVALVGSLLASFAFFLVSNFGAWLDPRMGYGPSSNELLRCYVMGIPFWKNTLVSDMFFSVGFVAIAQMVMQASGSNSLRSQRVD